MHCLACGITKETSHNEIYPYPDDGIVDDEPVCPLWVLECRGAEWRVAIVCHHCFHKLDPDMWINDRGWAFLNPITPFEKLPLPVEDSSILFQVETYGPSVKQPLSPR